MYSEASCQGKPARTTRSAARSSNIAAPLVRIYIRGRGDWQLGALTCLMLSQPTLQHRFSQTIAEDAASSVITCDRHKHENKGTALLASSTSHGSQIHIVSQARRRRHCPARHLDARDRVWAKRRWQQARTSAHQRALFAFAPAVVSTARDAFTHVATIVRCLESARH